MQISIEDLIINVNYSPIYEKFHKYKADNTIVNVNGGGDLGRSEHGDPHFEIKDYSVEIFIPSFNDDIVPKNITELVLKKGNLKRSQKKKILNIINNEKHLMEIASIWNRVNKDNPNPNLSFVKWVK